MENVTIGFIGFGNMAQAIVTFAKKCFEARTNLYLCQELG